MNPASVRRLALASSFLLSGFYSLAQAPNPNLPAAAKSANLSPAVQANYGHLPLSFEQNRGQTASEVQWLARGPASTLFLSGNDATIQLNHMEKVKRDGVEIPRVHSASLRMSLLNSDPAQSSVGEDLQPGKANYFTGADSSHWQKNVSLYGQVRLNAVYPGVDLLYHGEGGQLEYDFVVAPHADPARISLGFSGASPRIAANGDLLLPIPGESTVHFDKPVVYQVKDGVRNTIASSYLIAKDGHVSFQLGQYDHDRELVIDPKLVFLGTLGQGNYPYATNVSQITVDSTGAMYFIGTTNDPTYPVTSGSYQRICGPATGSNASSGGVYCGTYGATSAYISKISADGTTLVYSTYLSGGGGYEQGTSIAVDSAGVAYLLGATASTDFPITGDALQKLCQPISNPVLGPPIPAPISQCNNFGNGGGTEYTVNGPVFFYAKLSADGSSLIYSSFLGGSAAAYPVATALDAAGNWYVYGQTSVELARDIYTGANGTGGHVLFPGISGNAYLTYSSAIYNNQPTDPESIAVAAVLSKFSNDGKTLLYGTYFGDNVKGYNFNLTSMAVGANGVAFIGGNSLAKAIPTTPGVVKAACTAPQGNPYECNSTDGFVVAFDTVNAALLYSTRIGGSSPNGEGTGAAPGQQVMGLAADANNDVYVTGHTYDQTFPVPQNGYLSSCNTVNPNNIDNCDTAFALELNPTGTAILGGTFLAGPPAYNEASIGYKVKLDSNNKVYLYGTSLDPYNSFPLVTPVQAWQGANVLYIAALSSDLTKLLFSTRFGNPNLQGSNITAVNGLALDPNNNIYFAGSTFDQTFAATPGTYTTAVNSGTEAHTFFGKISPVVPPTATTLTIAPASANTGQNVTFTVNVAGTTQTTPVPTGVVTLTNNSTTPATVLGTINLDGTGSGSFSSTTLAGGSYSVTASYGGDMNYDISSSAAQTLTITGLPATTTTVSVSPSGALTYGQAVTLTATVTQTGGGSPTGTVTFTFGSMVLGTGTLNGSGVATLTTSVPAGMGTLGATYGGSSSSASSNGTGVSVSVAQAPLTVTAANVTRVIGAANPTLTGTVTGVVNNDVLTASYSTTATAASPAGTYPIIPAITGANISNYNVTLNNGTLTVTPGTATTTALTASASTVVVGASVTFTATVTGTSGTPAPTGTVTFKDGSTTLGTGTLNGSGVATFASTSLAVGQHSVTASYAGDTSNIPSVSSAVSVTVTAGPPDFSLTLAQTSGTVTNGTNEVVTVTVASVNGFSAATTLACSGLPTYSTCSFSPASVTPTGTAAATSTLTIATDVRAAAAALHIASQEHPPVMSSEPRIAIAGVVASLLLLPLAGWKNRKLRKLLVLIAVIVGSALTMAGITGCGGGSPKTPAGSYTVIVTGTSGTLTHTANYSITVQ